MPLTTWYPEPLEPAVAGLRTWRIPEHWRGDLGLGIWLLAWPTDPSESDYETWGDLLDESERVRCTSIGTRVGQIRFAASHAVARKLVPERRTWLEGRASLSHTATLAAVACADVGVGIDIEADVPRPRWHMADRQHWPESPARSWSVFVERWVQYEAAVKAGIGNDAGTALVGRVQGLGGGLTDHILAVRVKPRPAARVKPRPAASAKPRPAARVQPRPAASAKPRPAARVQPGPAARVKPG